jgi:predicted DNA-binding transcriptional regulator YafY
MGSEEAMMDPQLPGTTTDEEIKRTARVLQLAYLIASSPARYTRRALAQRFEISERMVTKDLSILRHGLLLDVRSSAEGYYFRETPQLPPLHYSFPEALALLMAVQAAQQTPGVASPDLAAAVARLEALFPPEFLPLLRQAAHAGREQPVGEHGQHRQHMLNLLLRALVNLQKIDILYETASRGGDISQRVVHPYAVMPYVRSWQLVAYCEKRQAVLMFKVDRIQQVRILAENYRIPQEFNLHDYMGTTWGVLREEGNEEVEVQLLFDSQAGRWVAEEQWHASQRVEQLEDGRVLFAVRVAINAEFVKWILRYGRQVKVLEPAELAIRVRAEHLAAAGQY